MERGGWQAEMSAVFLLGGDIIKKKVRTEEEKKRICELHNYYGIDYYTWGEDKDNQNEYEIEKDIKRMEAVTLIIKG